MEQGQFDNLPGKGKPLNLEENPHEDPAWRLAHHLLKSNDLSLPWIEALREIEADLEKARTSLRRAWDWRQAASTNHNPYPAVEAEWKRAIAAFEEQIDAINRRIFSYNLEVPLDRLQLRRLNTLREIEAFQPGGQEESPTQN